jgi:Amt family ammonium transporter
MSTTVPIGNDMTNLYNNDCLVDKADIVWVSIGSLLTMLMIPSVGLIFSGLVNQGSVSSILGLSLATLSITTFQWCIIGYSLVYGNSVSGIIGDAKYLGLEGLLNFHNKCTNQAGYEDCLANKYYWDSCGIPEILFFFFSSKFAGITSVLVIGSFSERLYLKYSLLFVAIWNILVYCPIGHWVWNHDGFMNRLGVRDFAGGLVIHISTGFSGLIASMYLGKRKNFENMPDVFNFPFFIFGTLLLWFGWFGFNGGSSFAINTIGLFAIINTNICASMSLIIWVIIDLFVYKKISSQGISLGVICGLVAITPSAGYIPLNNSFICGFLSGIVCWLFVFLKKKYKLYDDLEIFSCHGISGLVGAICCGLFANKDINPFLEYNGLAYSGDGSKIFILLQILGFAIIASYSSLMTFIILFIMKKFFNIGPKKEEDVYLDLVNFFDQNIQMKSIQKIEAIR